MGAYMKRKKLLSDVIEVRKSKSNSHTKIVERDDLENVAHCKIPKHYFDRFKSKDPGKREIMSVKRWDGTLVISALV